MGKRGGGTVGGKNDALEFYLRFDIPAGKALKEQAPLGKGLQCPPLVREFSSFTSTLCSHNTHERQNYIQALATAHSQFTVTEMFSGVSLFSPFLSRGSKVC